MSKGGRTVRSPEIAPAFNLRRIALLAASLSANDIFRLGLGFVLPVCGLVREAGDDVLVEVEVEDDDVLVEVFEVVAVAVVVVVAVAVAADVDVGCCGFCLCRSFSSSSSCIRLCCSRHDARSFSCISVYRRGVNTPADEADETRWALLAPELFLLL